ncbi:MAG: hypothetical protein KF819_18800 [Labilithrix sp.]|nr:hypothetical protein [Labilithrix sp.]
MSVAAHDESAVQAFTALGTTPRPTFPLVLVSVTVAVLAMHTDMVAKYSLAAFWLGVLATIALAIVVGRVMSALHGRWRTAAALALPTIGGALVGVLVQLVVLDEVTEAGIIGVRDLGGLVDSTEPVTWVAAGTVLGAAPALAVSIFLALAARAMRRVVGNDASEGFGVAFTGFAGVLAAFGMVVVEPYELAPLLGVTVLAALGILVAFLVDGARLRFLRRVFAGGAESTYDIVPADRFMHDPSLAPMVAQAGAVSVLVRREGRLGSYRNAAAEPIALLAETERETTLPLRRRRIAATALAIAMTGLSALSLLTQPELRDGLGFYADM